MAVYLYTRVWYSLEKNKLLAWIQSTGAELSVSSFFSLNSYLCLSLRGCLFWGPRNRTDTYMMSKSLHFELCNGSRGVKDYSIKLVIHLFRICTVRVIWGTLHSCGQISLINHMLGFHGLLPENVFTCFPWSWQLSLAFVFSFMEWVQSWGNLSNPMPGLRHHGLTHEERAITWAWRMAQFWNLNGKLEVGVVGPLGIELAKIEIVPFVHEAKIKLRKNLQNFSCTVPS